MKIITCCLTALLCLTGFTSAAAAAPDTSQPGFYRRSMIQLVDDLATHAHQQKPTFGLITNNATDLYQDDPQLDGANKQLLQSVDGVLLEGVRYTWKDSKMGVASSDDYRATVLSNIIAVQQAGKPVLSVDYCGNSLPKAEKALAENAPYNIITFPALTKELTSLEWGSLEKNTMHSVNSLNAIHSFIILLNPEKFASRQAYLEKLHASNADLLIIDLYYGDTPLTAQQIAYLQHRTDGTRRLVYAYLSVGEAENYRPYWQQSWNKHLPSWISDENSQWAGDYQVKYWRPEWQAILFKGKGSYLQQIINAGFDGAFLDTVDTYESFEDN